LSSAHEKWGQKQKCCVYNFVSVYVTSVSVCGQGLFFREGRHWNVYFLLCTV